jgi:hypothetical protein
MDAAAAYLADTRREFAKLKSLADRAAAQVPDARWFERLDPDGNSVAVLMKHLGGNLRSRWTDFLSSDGEKPDRNRDDEFEKPPQTRAETLALWEEGWTCVFEALGALTDADLVRTVTIRGEPHSVLQAIHRQIAHYSYHVGQICLLAKHFAAQAGRWTALTIPRHQSADFNARIQR